MAGHNKNMAHNTTSPEGPHGSLEAARTTPWLVAVPGSLLGTPLPARHEQHSTASTAVCSSKLRDALEDCRPNAANPQGMCCATTADTTTSTYAAPVATGRAVSGAGTLGKVVGGMADALRKQMNRIAMLSPRDMNVIAPISS